MSSFYIIGGAIDCGGNKISRTIFVNQQDGGISNNPSCH